MTRPSPLSTNTLKARELIVAPRLPDRPKEHTGNPFTTDGDLIVDCAVPHCSWHAMGPRALVKLAMDEHRRMFHSNQIGVVLLNQPGQ